MRFFAENVSVSEDGDYFQLSLESANSANEDIDQDPPSPYLVVQRSFEEPGTEVCYVETHDGDYRGHFRLRLKEFSSSRLAFKIVRTAKNYVEVSFDLSEPDFQRVKRIVNAIFFGNC